MKKIIRTFTIALMVIALTLSFSISVFAESTTYRAQKDYDDGYYAEAILVINIISASATTQSNKYTGCSASLSATYYDIVERRTMPLGTGNNSPSGGITVYVSTPHGEVIESVSSSHYCSTYGFSANLP